MEQSRLIAIKNLSLPGRNKNFKSKNKFVINWMSFKRGPILKSIILKMIHVFQRMKFWRLRLIQTAQMKRVIVVIGAEGERLCQHKMSTERRKK